VILLLLQEFNDHFSRIVNIGASPAQVPHPVRGVALGRSLSLQMQLGKIEVLVSADNWAVVLVSALYGESAAAYARKTRLRM